LLQQFAGFLLHGMTVAGGAQAEFALCGFGQLADGDASHAVNDSIDGNDCIEKNYGGSKRRICRSPTVKPQPHFSDGNPFL
jgi:hypothetical protein